MATGFAIWSFYAHGVAAHLLAAAAGAFIGIMIALWSIGGHISAFNWWIGAEGERDTAKQIEKLSADWHCEHDLRHDYGNWDHVLVGPPGVFLLDSKVLNNTAAAGNDALRSGRLAYQGGTFRAGAFKIKQALEQRLGARAPWVQSIVVVWGDFPQTQHQENDVIYLHGNHLLPWLTAQPDKLNAPQRAALQTALQEVRTALQRPG